MKLIGGAFVLVALLTGCAKPPRPTPYHVYVQTNKPLLDSGAMKASDYFTGMYGALIETNAPGHSLTRVNRVIEEAKLMESGAITRDEFDHRERAIRAEGVALYQADQAIATQQAQEQAYRQQQLGAQQMAIGAQLMQASQPQPLPVQQRAFAPQATGNAYVAGYLRNQSQNGSLRYCNYSNGAVLTVASHQLCPASTK